MTAAIAGFVLGAVAFWASVRILRAIAFGGSKMGSKARQKWLSQQTFESLLRHKKQIDDEIARRQP